MNVIKFKRKKNNIKEGSLNKNKIKNKKRKYLLNTKRKIYNKKTYNNKSKINVIKLIFLLLFLILFFIILLKIVVKHKKKKKLRIGVVGLCHELNVGNNLIKFAISIVLKNLGFIPYIIGTRIPNLNISFINRTTNLIVIKNTYNELKREDFDILMVNSDQTWRRFNKDILDYGFLKFAENWNIKKFVYGASLGYDYWNLPYNVEKKAKELLKNFTGISVREQNSIDLVKTHFGITPEFVLDPTLLIDKKYYLDQIKNYPKNNFIDENYIFIYRIASKTRIRNFTIKAINELNYKTYEYKLNNTYHIEDFIYYISNCKAVLTDSFHGTVFSIIFNKPFISFIKKQNAQARFKSLEKTFDLKNRIISDNEKDPDVSLLTIPLKINKTLIKYLRTKSINFIKKNLDLI